MDAIVTNLLTWITAHQGTANLVVFTVAAVESLAVVGVFAPGVAVLIGVGALIAVGALEFWPIYWWATAGALLGESFSYWLGRHFKHELRGLWPLKHHPKLLDRGEAFFRRHGGKSVLLGRFVGPLRAIVPTVAGMLNMPVWHFALINVLSALIWAPIYLLPGMIMGASMDLAIAVAGRLAVLLLLVLILVWGAIVLVRRSYAILAPRAAALGNRALQWGRQHPQLGRFITAIVDPQMPETKGLLMLGLILIASAWLSISTLHYLQLNLTLEQLDLRIHNFFQELRTPWGDTLLLAPALGGDVAVHIAATVALTSWLLWRQLWLAAAHWLAAAAFALAAFLALTSYSGDPQPFSDRWHGLPVLLVTCSAGFLSVLIARELPLRRRWIVYCCALLAASGATFAQLYFGTLLLSEALGALALGLLWLVILGSGYRRHIAPSVPLAGLIAIPVVTAIAVGSLRSADSRNTLLTAAAQTPPPIAVPHAQWHGHQWQHQPAYRIDLRGVLQQPLNLQWAGAPDALADYLKAEGWQSPPPLSWKSALNWLKPQAQVGELPLPPQVHLGYHPVLQLEYAELGLLLRLWPTGVIVSPGAGQLWEGYVSGQYLAGLTVLNLPRVDGRYDRALEVLQRQTQGLSNRLHYRPMQNANGHNRWSGATLLLWAPPVKENG